MRKLKSVDELKELLVDYAPHKQIALCKDKELCYFGSVPTLAEINRDYDRMAAVAWLVPQLTNLAEFCNCKHSFSEGQIRECAEIITAEYYYMKMSELMMFFYKFKNGEYGQFYGSVSPMTIMVSLRRFKVERDEIIFQHESTQKELERKEARKNAITYEQWLELKNSLTTKTVQQ